MALLKETNYKGIEFNAYWKIINYSFSEFIEEDYNENGALVSVKRTQLFVKVGRYSSNESEDMIDFTTFVFLDIPKDENINMEYVYNKLKEREEFIGATDI